MGIHGTNDTSCGYNMSHPCLNIHDLAARIQAGYRYDTIFFLASDHILEHCMTEPLTRRVRIIGIGGEVSLSCTRSDVKDLGTIFIFKGEYHWGVIPEIVIRGITFVNGVVLGQLAPMIVESCHFQEATIHLGSLRPYWYSPHPGLVTRLFPRPDSREGEEWLTLFNTTWAVIVQRSFSLAEAHGFRLTLTVVSKIAHIEMNQNDFGNRRLYIQGLRWLRFHSRRNIFHGNPINETMIGGISIFFHYRYADILVKECIFRNLIPASVALGAVYDELHGRWNRPLLLHSEIRFAFQEEDRPDAVVQIADSIFDGNQGGLRYAATTNNIAITNCTFTNNHVFTRGGAMELFEDENAWTVANISGSKFSGNMVGMSNLFPGQSRDTVEVSTAEGLVNASFMDGVLSFSDPLGWSSEVGGYGGALYLQDVNIFLSDSLFSNNTPKRAGGAVWAKELSTFKIENISVQGSNINNKLEGALLYISNTWAVLNNSQLYSQSYSNNIFYFSSEKESLTLNSVLFSCPENSQLTDEGTIMGFDGKHNRLRYQCDGCQNSYSLGHGSAFYNEDGKMNLSQIICDDCPYGANCSGKHIRVKPNFWGKRHNGKVYTLRCPSTYCCNGIDVTCKLDNMCMSNRDGILCGKCHDGFSEALFSSRCIKNEKCKDTWILVMVVISCLVYSFFLLFQKDFINATMNQVSFDTCTQARRKENEAVTTPKEGGGFVIILFYYFQDASLITIPVLNPMPLPKSIHTFKSMIGSLFKFRIELFSLAAGDVCAFVGLTAQGKVLFKASFVPLLLFILFTIYGIGRCLLPHKKRIGMQLVNRAISALLVALMFSYQKLAVTTFQQLLCVPFLDRQILFMNGNVECYQPWQIVVLIYATMCICPFFVILSFGPGLLKKGFISHKEFALACFFPFPCLLVWLFKLALHKHPATPQLSTEAELVCSVLQGPYRPLQILSTKGPSLCWAGVLIAFRLLIVLAKTFIAAHLSRQLLMCLVVMTSMFLQARFSPYKGPKANAAGAFSSFALFVVAVINSVRAVFVETGYTPVGPVKDLAIMLEMIENAFLIWLPLVGFVVLLAFIATALFISLIKLVKMCSASKRQIDKID